MIPDKGVELLKGLCGQVSHSSKGMQLLMELATNRPRKLNYLSALLEFCSHANEEVRYRELSLSTLALAVSIETSFPLHNSKADFVNSLHNYEILTNFTVRSCRFGQVEFHVCCSSTPVPKL